MKTGKALAIALPCVGAAAVGVLAYCIAPGRAAKEKKAPFRGANIAHRGLHTPDKSVPENSLPAFAAAVENGYGIELDVHLTADDRLAVFHDDALERMCGVEGRVEDMTWAQLQKLSLAGTAERIPLLGEVLAVVDGRTPIVLELKKGKRNKELCARVRDVLSCYKGDVCIESFDPRIVRWWKKNEPDMLRGQLSCADFGEEVARPVGFVLSRLLTNFLGRPQFIAYGLDGRRPLNARLCCLLGAMNVRWTSHDPASEKGSDTVIFEFYRPEKRFK